MKTNIRKRSLTNLEEVMKVNINWRVWMLLVACLQISACRQPGRTAEASPREEEVAPAQVEHLDGDEPTRVTLTELAAKRLDIQTAPAKESTADAAGQVVIPYNAILYDIHGQTWTYINPQPLIFLRHPVVVDRIEGDLAYLSDGPAPGMAVVTVGAQELYGAEVEFEEE